MKTAFLTVPPGRTGEHGGQYFGPNSIIEVTELEAAALREGGVWVPCAAPTAKAAPPEGPKASDAAAREAATAGLDLATVEGTGAEGLITVEDVRKAVKARPGDGA